MTGQMVTMTATTTHIIAYYHLQSTSPYELARNPLNGLYISPITNLYRQITVFCDVVLYPECRQVPQNFRRS